MKKYLMNKHLAASIVVTASISLVAAPAFADAPTGIVSPPSNNATSSTPSSKPSSKPSSNRTCENTPTASNISTACPSGPTCPADPSIAENTKECNQDTLKVRVIKKEATAEINRRLTYLKQLLAIINESKKLNASDKASLTTEIDDEMSGPAPYGLVNLQTKLNADVTLADVEADRTSIYTQYRVYLLICPKVNIIATADYQIQVEANLTKFAGVLQTRITAAQQQGKNVSSLQTELASMQSEVTSANTASNTAETNVLPINPAGYDGNTSILVPYRQDVGTAHSDMVTARNDAQAIVKGLEQL